MVNAHTIRREILVAMAEALEDGHRVALGLLQLLLLLLQHLWSDPSPRWWPNCPVSTGFMVRGTARRQATTSAHIYGTPLQPPWCRAPTSCLLHHLQSRTKTNTIKKNTATEERAELTNLRTSSTTAATHKGDERCTVHRVREWS